MHRNLLLSAADLYAQDRPAFPTFDADGTTQASQSWPVG